MPICCFLRYSIVIGALSAIAGLVCANPQAEMLFAVDAVTAVRRRAHITRSVQGMKQLFLQPQTPGQDTREYTYQMIRQNLLELTLPPHTQLSEAMVAEMLGVSRTPVHDAFARLDEEGLMCAVPQKGTLVAPISANRVQQGVFMKVHLGRAVLERICEKGLGNEPFFALESNINRQYFCLGAENYRELAALDAAFHRALYESAGLCDVWQALSIACADIVRVQALGHLQELYRTIVSEHADLFAAVRRKDAEQAAVLLERHYLHALDCLSVARTETPNFFDGAYAAPVR